MKLTRVNTAKLRAASEKAAKKIEEAMEIMAPFFVVLTDQERANTPRTRSGLVDGVRKLARVSASHAAMTAASGFDAEAAIEDADNIEAIRPLGDKSNLFVKRLDDSVLTWSAEAQQPSLVLYGMAQVKAKDDGALQEVVDALAPVFAVPSRKKAAAAAEPVKK